MSAYCTAAELFPDEYPLSGRHPAPQHVDADAVELVEGAALRTGCESERVLHGAAEIARLSARERALGAGGGIDRQIHGARQKRCCRGLPTPRPRTTGRPPMRVVGPAARLASAAARTTPTIAWAARPELPARPDVSLHMV